MLILRQNILGKIMLKNVKLSYKNVKLQLATAEVGHASNLCSNPRIRIILCQKGKLNVKIKI